MKRKHFLISFLLIAGLYACNKQEVLAPYFEGFIQPSNFPAPAYNFTNNAVTKNGFELGRKLFYETNLSANNTISCGICHVQTSAFTHHGHIVSHGIFDRVGTRNAPPIMNLAWNTSFMWDGGIADMDLQSIAPITNHDEMDENMANVLQKLRTTPTYPPLFKAAFGSEDITTSRFLKAISQFMSMCVSSNSKYDSVMRQQGAAFTAAEFAGYNLVKAKCAPCHKEPLFTDMTFRNNGIAASNVNDLGRYGITQIEADKYRFKVPALRNLSYTGPYMHDGRFLTLEAVLDHYANGIQQTQNIDVQLQQGIRMTAVEKQQILSFLKTLDDKSFLLDKRFSE